MLTLISPSKTLDYSVPDYTETYTTPELLNDTEILVKEMKKKSAKSIGKLMEISDNLAQLNFERFQSFSTPFTPENSRQALFVFKGDVYLDIDLENYTKKEFDFAQRHLRILSGLYGLLKPLDLIQPYRLEMGIPLKNKKGKNLYDFWQDKIANLINHELSSHKNKVLINLASIEYFKAVNTKKIEGQIISPIFKEYKNGSYKSIMLYAKRARGMMTNFIIQNKIEDKIEKIKTFNVDRYEYNEKLSTESEWVFTR
jgi:uncharacterized protein